MVVITVVSFRIFRVPGSNKLQEASVASLLEKTKETAGQGFFLVCRDFGNGALLENIASVDDFELQVAVDLGVHQHFDEYSAGHDELGDEIDVIVPEASKLAGDGSSGFVDFKDLLQVERGRGPTVVVVAVKVEDLLSLDGKKTAEDAFLQASSKNDNVVFFIHSKLALSLFFFLFSFFRLFLFFWGRETQMQNDGNREEKEK